MVVNEIAWKNPSNDSDNVGQDQFFPIFQTFWVHISSWLTFKTILEMILKRGYLWMLFCSNIVTKSVVVIFTLKFSEFRKTICVLNKGWSYLLMVLDSNMKLHINSFLIILVFLLQLVTVFHPHFIFSLWCERNCELKLVI